MRVKVTAGLFAAVCLAQACCLSPASGRELTWDELRGRFEPPAWFEEARFGIWLHWGAQTQPERGGGWYARHMYMPDTGSETWGKEAYPYHCKTYGHPSRKGFKDVIHEWKAEKLDADALMAYFKKIGARYFLIMANHHDHFDNFASSFHPWNSVNVGPKRDIVGEFEKSAKKYKIPFGVSSHDDRFLSWWLPAFGADKTGPYAGVPYDGNMTKEQGKGTWWEGLDPADLYGLPPAKRTPEWEKGVKENWLRRHQELVSKYDVDMLWFDGWGFPYGEYGKKLCAYYYNRRLRQGKVTGLVVGKFANEPSTARDIECGGANSILPRVWQGTITPAGWFYKKDRPLRHSARTIIEMLADMNSKNGNMLLNVELLPDGTIPADHKKMLDEIGAWVNLNGEAIYGSRPWKVYGDNLNSIVAELKNKKKPSETDLAMLKKLGSASEQFNERTVSSPPYGHQEVRFTTRDGFLYAFVLNPREGEVKLPSLGYRSAHNDRHIASVEMLGGKGKVPFRQTEEALAFDVPAERPNPYACVFKIKFR